ncbi:MAG: ABC transporter permease, partial [Clostridiales bacterium]|nr:ABC transporter permease [Clostridiales bacterium]
MPFADLIANLISETLLFAVPLLLVAIGGLFSWRGGIRNIALEGTMLMGSLSAGIAAAYFSYGDWAHSHQIPAMLICISLAAAAGIVISILLGLATIRPRTNHYVVGMSLNMFVPALAIVIIWALFGKGGGPGGISYSGNAWRRITLQMVGLNPESAGTFLKALFKSMYLTTP